MMLFHLFLLILPGFSSTKTVQRPPSKQLASGSDAGPCEFPHMVYLDLHFSPGRSFCGGSILDKNYILTSARCLNGDLNDITVHIGSIKKNSGTQVIKGKEWFLHPDFQLTSKKIVNDIALVKLEKEIVFDVCVQAISLPTKGQQLSDKCYITGWGFLTDDLQPTRSLKKAVVGVISTQKCQKQFPGIFPDQHICIGDQTYMGPSSCLGDSGGPLTCTNPADNKSVVAGVASYSYSCNQGFSVFTNTENFVDWVKTKMQQ
uniref:SP1-Lol-1 n=1 Tax=Uroteuthis noctiluca TaxID=78427 RepID=R4FJ67_9MOLL